MRLAFLKTWRRGVRRIPTSRRRYAPPPAGRVRVEALEDRALPSSVPIAPYGPPIVADGAAPVGWTVYQQITDPDGKTILVGSAPDAAKVNAVVPTDFAVARYNADGSLDTSFGDGGLVVTAVNGGTDVAYGAVVQPDGKLVVVGSADSVTTFDDSGAATAVQPGGFALVRYNADGNLDATFGTGGMVVTSFGTPDQGVGVADAVALQPEGGIVVGGSAPGTDPSGNEQSSESTLARYTADGALDDTFGNAGVVQLSFGGADAVGTVSTQSDGTILATGTSYQDGAGVMTDGSGPYTLSVTVQLNADGSLDTSFGDGGELIAGQPDSQGQPGGDGGSGSGSGTVGDGGNAFDPGAVIPPGWAVNEQVTQPDGKVIVVGSAYDAATSAQDFAVARFNADGSLDTTFGTGGLVVTPFATPDFNAASADVVALQPDGGIVVGGSAPGTDPSGSKQPSEFTLARYTADGALDSSFGNGGIVQVSFGGEDQVDTVAIQPDGTIVATGTSFASGSQSSYTLSVTVQLNPDGSLDSSFGNGGELITGRVDWVDSGSGVGLGADGGGGIPVASAGSAPPSRPGKDGGSGGAQNFAGPGALSADGASPVSAAGASGTLAPPSPAIILPGTAITDGVIAVAHQLAVLMAGQPSPVPPAPTGGPAQAAANSAPSAPVAAPAVNPVNAAADVVHRAAGPAVPDDSADGNDQSPSDPLIESNDVVAVRCDDYFAELSLRPPAAEAGPAEAAPDPD